MSQTEAKTAAELSGRGRTKIQGKTVKIDDVRTVNDTRERRVYKDPKSGKEVVITSWLGEHDGPALLSNEIGEKCDILNQSHGFAKMPGPGGKGNIPVWQTPFDCDFCDEKFQHLTNDYLTVELKEKGMKCYEEHLRSEHMDNLAVKWSRDVTAPDTTNAHPLTDLQNQNDELREELSELKGMMMTLMESKTETAKEPAPKRKYTKRKSKQEDQDKSETNKEDNNA